MLTATHVVKLHIKIGHFSWNYEFRILPVLNHELLGLEFLGQTGALINLADFTLLFGFVPNIKICLHPGETTYSQTDVDNSKFEEKLKLIKQEFGDVITSKIGKCDVLPYRFTLVDDVPVWDRHFRCPPPKLKAL
ncbi:hypothetical protein PR048_021803 [Dryococelus australis]|uniref:Uncharacterized protein n=1 Tax=Dryococelus australis TaxID=614101 RepID=A0ABQ9GZA3_9NEOP|nr:hypothetical protein PR048_021803 [Dryococelus australis]